MLLAFSSSFSSEVSQAWPESGDQGASSRRLQKVLRLYLQRRKRTPVCPGTDVPPTRREMCGVRYLSVWRWVKVLWGRLGVGGVKAKRQTFHPLGEKWVASEIYPCEGGWEWVGSGCYEVDGWSAHEWLWVKRSGCEAKNVTCTLIGWKAFKTEVVKPVFGSDSGYPDVICPFFQPVKLGHPVRCDLYCDCTSGEPVERDCGPHHFNPATRECEADYTCPGMCLLIYHGLNLCLAGYKASEDGHLQYVPLNIL